VVLPAIDHDSFKRVDTAESFVEIVGRKELDRFDVAAGDLAFAGEFGLLLVSGLRFGDCGLELLLCVLELVSFESVFLSRVPEACCGEAAGGEGDEHGAEAGDDDAGAGDELAFVVSEVVAFDPPGSPDEEGGEGGCAG
jgi:hypothetical protein